MALRGTLLALALGAANAINSVPVNLTKYMGRWYQM